MFSLMKYDNFFGGSEEKRYYVSSYFYRIEFQQRGAPHVHSLLWLKDKNENDAPTFWSEDKDDSTDPDEIPEKLEKRKEKLRSL